MIFFRKKRRVWPYIVLPTLLIFVGITIFVFKVASELTTSQVLQSGFVQERVRSLYGDEAGDLVNLLPNLLGFTKPVTYLVLFENNTEMRPGGGFLGSYGVVRMEKGKPEVLVVEGTESLDGRAPESWQVEPPEPIGKYLGVKSWYFRDSNWSPDFAESAKLGLSFYRGEEGLGASDVSTVVAVTPTVLEKLLSITGPIVIENITFESSSVTEVLEYEVEFGYRDRGVSFQDRKKILDPFFKELLTKVSTQFLTNSKSYTEVAKLLIEQKHILAYSEDKDLQQKFVEHGLTGSVKNSDADYLLWVDANLGTLKTDHAILRTLSYNLSSASSIQAADNLLVWSGKARMDYKHIGKKDWRTTFYRSYARVYVPLGSVLKEVVIIDDLGVKTVVPASDIDQGEELGKQWFGSLVFVEPGQTGSIEFSYELPSSFTSLLEKGLYSLSVQKQLGLPEMGLTLDLDFGTTIIVASPAEDMASWGDSRYQLETQVLSDREFNIEF